MFEYNIYDFIEPVRAVVADRTRGLEAYKKSVEQKLEQAIVSLIAVLQELNQLTGLNFSGACEKALASIQERSEDELPWLESFPQLFTSTSIFRPWGPLFELHSKGSLLLEERVQNALRQVSRIRRFVWRHTEHLQKLQDAAGYGILNPQFDIDQAVTTAIQLEGQRHAIDFRYVEFLRETDQVSPFCADEARLLIPFRELIRNAMFATRTVVDRYTRRTVRKRSVVKICTEQRSAASLHVTIEDNGIGISPETLPHFKCYGFTAQQDDVSFGGLGIGVPTAIDSVVELGGSVDYESDRNWGTRVTLCIPLTDACI